MVQLAISSKKYTFFSVNRFFITLVTSISITLLIFISFPHQVEKLWIANNNQTLLLQEHIQARNLSDTVQEHSQVKTSSQPVQQHVHSSEALQEHVKSSEEHIESENSANSVQKPPKSVQEAVDASNYIQGENHSEDSPKSVEEDVDALNYVQGENYEELCEFSPKDSSHCPMYFTWIAKDLAPWKETGISKEDIQAAKPQADFRVVIYNGSLYMERYHKCYQRRDDYTLWGLLMLLQEYPGMVPNLELMGNCGDYPMISRSNYNLTAGKWPPPPLFVYCTTTHEEHYDIVWPDWSFWGWPEVNISPWKIEKEKIFRGAARKDWLQRKAIAHWKGNYHMGPARADLVKCTRDRGRKYNLVTHGQDWRAEIRRNFQHSDLSKQCLHRYKVYVEGKGWSVSLKYIMSCGSTLLLIEPNYQEFFARGFIPFVHFWPIERHNICNSIKNAVDWGNAHPKEAARIGKCGQSFLDKELKMEFVYQYMLHLLQGYAKLLRFEPVPPEGVKPMSLDSPLPYHEITMPSRKKRKSLQLCSMPKMSADVLIKKQRSQRPPVN